MAYYDHYNGHSGHSYHPSEFDTSRGSRFDGDLVDELRDAVSGHGHREHRSRHAGSRSDASRSRHESSRRHNGSSRHGMSHASSHRSGGDSRRSMYEADRYERSDASTLHPDDSSSNVDRRFGRPHESNTRDRPYDRFEQVISGYPSTSTSSRHRAHSITHSHAYDAGPTYTYVPRTRSEMAPEVVSRVSSRRSSSSDETVTHPHAYDPAGRTHTWNPPSPAPTRYQPSSSSHQSRSRRSAAPSYYPSETSHRSHRSRRSAAPSPELRASSRYQTMGEPYLSSPGNQTPMPFPPCPIHGYNPPRTPVLHGRSGGYVSSISSVMGRGYEEVYDEEDEFEYMAARMSGL